MLVNLFNKILINLTEKAQDEDIKKRGIFFAKSITVAHLERDSD